jgi:hypothetical protein
MVATFGALAPVFILMALGWLLRAHSFPWRFAPRHAPPGA